MDGQLQAALVGALVGGLASGLAALFGSVLVNRWQLKKSMRLRVYDELLPKIKAERAWYDLARADTGDGKPADSEPPSAEFIDRMFALIRAGAIIGGRTAKLTKEIQRTTAGQAYYVKGESGLRPEWIPDQERMAQLDKRLTGLLYELERQLAKKLN
jgi:hypothetical protein